MTASDRGPGPVVMMIDNPLGSQEIYDRLRDRLGLRRPPGGVVHIAGPSPQGGWRVVQVWPSREEGLRFLREQFGPAWQAVASGPPPQPEFWPVHHHLIEAVENAEAGR